MLCLACVVVIVRACHLHSHVCTLLKTMWGACLQSPCLLYLWERERMKAGDRTIRSIKPSKKAGVIFLSLHIHPIQQFYINTAMHTQTPLLGNSFLNLPLIKIAQSFRRHRAHQNHLRRHTQEQAVPAILSHAPPRLPSRETQQHHQQQQSLRPAYCPNSSSNAPNS